MMLVVVSGLSGSGKSTALHALEDLEFYCIDNLPVGLLPAFSEHVLDPGKHFPQRIALGIDARNIIDDIQRFPTTLETMRKANITCDVIFLNTEDDVLIKRFSETRRKHPLSGPQTSLADAITRERDILEPITDCADLFIDTSYYNVHQLREVIMNRLGNRRQEEMSIQFKSFGFKYGLPTDADFVFDVRCLPNPHWLAALRPYTGLQLPVIEYLQEQPAVDEMFRYIRDFLETWIPHFVKENRTYMTIAIGCTGGMHRSVYLTDTLARYFTSKYPKVMAQHRELP